MIHLLRAALVALALTCGVGIATGAVAQAAGPRSEHADANLLGWLHAVSKVESLVVNVGNDLGAVGGSPTYAKALIHIRHAEGLVNRAISVYRTAPQPPTKYHVTNALLGRSLQEYKSGLAIIDKGFARHNNGVIRRGLRIITRGSADQNRVAARLKKINAS